MVSAPLGVLDETGDFILQLIGERVGSGRQLGQLVAQLL
jgi:hypothetical protein